MTDNLNEEFQKYKTEIQRIHDKTARPDDKVPDADVREVLEVVKKIGALGTRLRASVDAAREPEPQADPLAAGAKLHTLAMENRRIQRHADLQPSLGNAGDGTLALDSGMAAKRAGTAPEAVKALVLQGENGAFITP